MVGLNDIATCARRMGQLEHARGMGAHALDSPTSREIQTRVTQGACPTDSEQNSGHENVEKTPWRGGKGLPEVDAVEKSALHCKRL